MSQDAQNKYEFKLKTIDAVYQAADKKEQRILDQQKTDLATNNTTYTNYINDIQTAIKSATDSGDTALAGQISQLIKQPLDPNSKTFKTDYQKALSKLGALQAKVTQKKDLQYVSGTENQPAGYFDKATGKFTPIGGGGSGKGSVSDISPYQAERQIRILDSVKDLEDRVSGRTVGIVSLGRIFPGSIQKDFQNDLSALRANIAFGELTAMREASKTGGALGQVSNIELGLLESALAGLDQSQSPANFRKNLERVKSSITRWQNAVNTLDKVQNNSEEQQLRAMGYTETQINELKKAK